MPSLKSIATTAIIAIVAIAIAKRLPMVKDYV